MTDECRVGYRGVFAGENGELAARCGASRGARIVAFVLVLLVLFVTMMFYGQRAAFAAEDPAVVVSAALAQEKYGCPEDPNRSFEEGGGLCVSDWIDYLPLGIASIATVIVVDSAFLYYIYRKRQAGEELA